MKDRAVTKASVWLPDKAMINPLAIDVVAGDVTVTANAMWKRPCPVMVHCPGRGVGISK